MSETPSVKQRINAGEIISIAGVSMNATREELEHAANQCDMFSIDGQHSPFSEEELVAFCAKAEALDMPVQFRIEHTRHTYLIGRYLDLGPTAILVPEVREEATVDEAIKYFYYPQKGKRSWGGTARRGINKRPDRLEYAAWWNDYGVSNPNRLMRLSTAVNWPNRLSTWSHLGRTILPLISNAITSHRSRRSMSAYNMWLRNWMVPG